MKALEQQFRETFTREPKPYDLLKWRLYREQGGKCAYSLQPIRTPPASSQPGYLK